MKQEDLSLKDLVQILVSKWWIICLVTLFTTGLSIAATLLVSKKYSATIIVSPVSNSAGSSQLGALGSMASQFGGLAALAGVTVSGDAKKQESVAVLQSESLTEDYIRECSLLPILYKNMWDPIGNRWLVKEPDKIPTLWKANAFFKTKIRTLSTDTKSGLTTLTITWKDPVLAAKWANGLVKMTNDYLRDQAIRESERNVAYLTDQATKTDIVGIKQAIFSLLQSEIGKAMLARGNEQYALKVIDPAFAPEIPSTPNSPLWILIGIMIGVLSGVTAVLAHRAWRNE